MQSGDETQFGGFHHPKIAKPADTLKTQLPPSMVVIFLYVTFLYSSCTRQAVS